MKSVVFCAVVCLLFSSVVGNNAARNRLIVQIRNVAAQLQECQALLATTTPLPETTSEFDSEESSPTPGSGSMMETTGMGEGEMSMESREVDDGLMRDTRSNAKIMRQLRAHLRSLRREVNECEEMLDD